MPKITLNIEELAAEKQELDAFLARPDAYSDPDFTKKNKRLTELQNLLEKGMLRETLEAQLAEAKELSGGNDELAELAKMEIADIEEQLPKLEEELAVVDEEELADGYSEEGDLLDDEEGLDDEDLLLDDEELLDMDNFDDNEK